MSRYCIICGKQLRTGRKYCYLHRNAHYKLCPNCNAVLEYNEFDIVTKYRCPKCEWTDWWGWRRRDNWRGVETANSSQFE